MRTEKCSETLVCIIRVGGGKDHCRGIASKYKLKRYRGLNSSFPLDS
jgi:hypothetical protein